MEDAVAARQAAERSSAERVRAEGSLREAEDRLERAVAATGVALFEWNLLDDHLEVNEPFRKLFGLEGVRGRLRGSRVFANVPVLDLLTAVEPVGRPGRHCDFEWELPGPEGEIRFVLINGWASFSATAARQPERLCGTCVDISARKRAEIALRQAHDELEQRVRQRTAELSEANKALEHELQERRAAEAQVKELFRRLISAREDERSAMARDTHDQLGQQMTALRLSLEVLHAQARPHPRLIPLVSQSQALAAELDQNVDFLTAQLRPALLDHLGLVAALQELVTEWSSRFGTSATYDTQGCEALRLPADVELNLYRIVQEALHNVHKHADAREVRVSLGQVDGSLFVRVSDDGRGFDPQHASGSGRSLGLISMRERAGLIGAEFCIQSGAGDGTEIVVEVPIAAAARPLH
jgi:signal transduction histidine kinase